MKAAVLSPHLDDAILSCWHVLDGRDDVTVVNVFTASPSPGTRAPWWDRLTGAQDPVARMGERRTEDRRALDLVARDAVHLDLLDAQYGNRELSAASLAGRLGALLQPGTVVLAPAGLSRHPDHEIVRDAALELARSGRSVILYADLPHGIAHGWPGWVAGTPEPAGLDIEADWAGVLTGAGLSVQRLVPRVRPLDDQARRRKLRALAEYRTQRAALDGLAFVPLEDPRALAFEVSWAVPGSALGLPQEHGSQTLVAEAGSEPLRDRR